MNADTIYRKSNYHRNGMDITMYSPVCDADVAAENKAATEYSVHFMFQVNGSKAGGTALIEGANNIEEAFEKAQAAANKKAIEFKSRILMPHIVQGANGRGPH